MTITASLIVRTNLDKDRGWVEARTFSVTGLPVVRIGRDHEVRIGSDIEYNDLDLPYCRNGDRSYVSRRHCTLFLKISRQAYEIMDGTITPINLGNKWAKIQPSSCGVIVNNHKLDAIAGERWLLRDHDIITIVPDQIELIYRQQYVAAIVDGLDTFVPEGDNCEE